MDSAVIGGVLGAVVGGLCLAIVTALAGLAKSLIHLITDVELLKADLDHLEQRTAGRLDVIEDWALRRDRVAEARSAESFTEPNPISEYELSLFRKSRERGARAMADHELIAGIHALDREMDRGEIPQAKRGDAIWLLATFNGELARRERDRETSAALQPLQPPTRPTWWRVLWPF